MGECRFTIVDDGDRFPNMKVVCLEHGPQDYDKGSKAALCIHVAANLERGIELDAVRIEQRDANITTLEYRLAQAEARESGLRGALEHCRIVIEAALFPDAGRDKEEGC